MPENKVKLIHVFMHKHIKQLVLQTSHNSTLIHYKCMRLYREKNRWESWCKPKSCIPRCGEESTVGLYQFQTFFLILSFSYLILCPPRFVQVWNPHKTTGDWRLFSRVHSGGAGVMHWAHPKLSRPTNSLSPRRRQLRYHYACHCKWTTSSVCVCDKATHLHMTWSLFSWLPSVFFPHPTSPLFVTLIQYALLPPCSTLLLLSHTHTHTCKC